MAAQVRADPGAVLKLRCLFLKLRSLLEVPCCAWARRGPRARAHLARLLLRPCRLLPLPAAGARQLSLQPLDPQPVIWCFSIRNSCLCLASLDWPGCPSRKLPPSACAEPGHHVSFMGRILLLGHGRFYRLHLRATVQGMPHRKVRWRLSCRLCHGVTPSTGIMCESVK